LNKQDQNALQKAKETLREVEQQISDLKDKAGNVDELFLRVDMFDQIDHLKTRKRRLERQIGTLKKVDDSEATRVLDKVDEANRELRHEADQAEKKFNK
jgi:hypothetical protein